MPKKKTYTGRLKDALDRIGGKKNTPRGKQIDKLLKGKKKKKK